MAVLEEYFFCKFKRTGVLCTVKKLNTCKKDRKLVVRNRWHQLTLRRIKMYSFISSCVSVSDCLSCVMALVIFYIFYLVLYFGLCVFILSTLRYVFFFFS